MTGPNNRNRYKPAEPSSVGALRVPTAQHERPEGAVVGRVGIEPTTFGLKVLRGTRDRNRRQHVPTLNPVWAKRLRRFAC